MGIHHARMVAAGKIPGCQLSALADSDPTRLHEFPTLPHFNDSQSLIHSGQIDALLIATPHYSHTSIGISALQAGLHVLVEKPLSVHKADCERLIAAHTNKKQIFAAMFNQRSDPAYQKIRHLVQSGQLGRIQRIHWTVTDWFRTQAYYDSGGWRATWAGEGGGVLLNQCVHNLDLFQWIFGLPESVRALCRIGHHHNIEVEDEVTALFSFAQGATAVLATSTGEAPGVNRLEIAGDLGRLCLEDNRLTLIRNEIPSSLHSRQSREAYETPPTWKIDIPLPGHRGEQHAAILKNFCNAILHREPLLSPAAEGIHSVELINAMLLSSFQDQTIHLPLSSSRYERFLKKLIASSKKKKTIRRYQGRAGNYLVQC
ncbi:MAG: Gfo/Idh/MocA family oxidoreductase [Blastochloris sp.]|nr:Gfo/Idh/MocA family oxidoreductase [Blastochloris sp.]